MPSREKRTMDARTIAFVLMMGILGNTLFAITYYGGSIAPGVAVDFSLIAVFVAAYYGGPWIGLASGLFVGIMPGIMFGPMGMASWLGLVGLPLGKGLTGLTAGIVSRGLKLGHRPYSSVAAVPASLLSYIPECIFTYAYFSVLMPFFFGNNLEYVFIYVILPKALAEVTIMSFIMGILIGNHGFSDFVSRFFTKTNIVPKLRTATSD